MASAREAFIETTARLLEMQGYFGTGLNQIIAESGAPKGSLYYYFPEGKESLTIEVIERRGRVVAERIRSELAQDPDSTTAIYVFICRIAHYVEQSEYRGGGPIATVALETANSSERIRTACRDAYRSWQHAFAEKLVASGFSEPRATRLSVTIIALIEGATILARTEYSPTPLQDVAEEVRLLLSLSSRT